MTEQCRHLNLKMETKFTKLLIGDNHVPIHVEVKMTKKFELSTT
jgi:hypothetical protein